MGASKKILFVTLLIRCISLYISRKNIFFTKEEITKLRECHAPGPNVAPAMGVAS
jgi:hypothetical protein